MQVIATPCLAEELKPGDLFSTRGPAYWDNFAEFPSCGELVYIRTEMPASAFPDAESVVFRITIHKEAPSKLAERAAELEWNKPYPHSKAGEGPVTIEQLDILQFGRVLHERPTPSVQEDGRRQRQLIRGRRRPKQNNPDGYPDDVAPSVQEQPVAWQRRYRFKHGDEAQPWAAEAAAALLSLLNVMRSAYNKDLLMSVWERDIKAVEDAIALYALPRSPAADVLERIAKENISDPATDDLTVPLAIELAEVRAQLASARKALEFYADPFAWKKLHDPEDVVRVPDFYSETSFGDTALVALSNPLEPQP